ncbi:hypothetical protein LI291_11855 [Intestinibacillus massiliensis]|uniref:hypothetical protein n=1 Tax=Intestinibacillus massiliensis TaxID=1871029 RepID=UPI000B35205B|nr:hypothetical protein [Intestinibacillus massiliensis]MCB6366866.1 hypothetical protein [Intestinibacillus massiliensis]
MKKLAQPLISLLLACSLAACGKAAEHTFTGTLEENKGSMITVAKDGDSYVFGTDGITISAKDGDTVTVTYTGDIEEVGALLDATKVEKTDAQPH